MVLATEIPSISSATWFVKTLIATSANYFMSRSCTTALSLNRTPLQCTSVLSKFRARAWAADVVVFIGECGGKLDEML